MPLIFQKHMNEDVLLGVWHISEDLDTLLNKVRLTPEDKTTLFGFKNDHRKREWLSVRVLLRQLINSDNMYISYNEHNRPYFQSDSTNISISHSKDYTTVLLGKQRKVGIDIEFISDRIIKIAHKFIHPTEYITKNDPLKIQHLYIHWCAKEAIYKIHATPHLQFKNNIIIEPFEPENNGFIFANVRMENEMIKKYSLNYFIINEYILVWCCE